MSIVLPSVFTFGNDLRKEWPLVQQIEYDGCPRSKLKYSMQGVEYNSLIGYGNLGSSLEQNKTVQISYTENQRFYY